MSYRHLLVPMLALAACSSGVATEPSPASGATRQPIVIGPGDQPGNLIPGADIRLADLIGAADVGQTFGTDDGHIPYPDTYWPFTQNGIDADWSGQGSPLSKLMSVVNPSQTAAAQQWEQNNHGSKTPGVQGWWGHCPGWTGSAMSNAPIQQPVYAMSDGQGGLTSCTAGANGCVKFEIGDINALEAEVFVDGQNSFIGARCDTPANQIKRDQYGRIQNSGCQGVNAGSLLVVLANRMKLQSQAMAIDAQNDFNTDQIWNQPAYRYTVYAYQPLTTVQAANLVASGQMTGSLTTYPWDAQAQGFVRVDIGIKWVSEYGPNMTAVSGAQSTRETRFVAVIELDAAPDNASANVIGGEYLDDSSVGADRLTVPPFAWISNGPGPEGLDPSVGGNDHNPYVSPGLVGQLARMGAGQQPTPTPTPTSCASYADCANGAACWAGTCTNVGGACASGTGTFCNAAGDGLEDCNGNYTPCPNGCTNRGTGQDQCN
jgi:hypothetical protein